MSVKYRLFFLVKVHRTSQHLFELTASTDFSVYIRIQRSLQHILN